MEVVEKSIILTFDELRILLFSQGERSCEGVFMPRKIFSPEIIINALDVMNKNGLLIYDESRSNQESLPAVLGDDEDADGSQGEKYTIREDLLDMLEIIATHTGSEIIEIESGRKLFCYYSEKGILTSEKCINRKDSVRLTQYTTDSFSEFRKAFEEGTEWSLLQ